MHIGNIIYIYIALFTGFYTSQVVQDFFHQEYENQHLPLPPKQRNHLIWVNIKCFNYYLSQKSNAKYLDARWKLESFTLMALSSSKSSSNRLWRNISACWYKRRSRVSWLFFCGFDWWKANHKQQMLEGAILPSLFFWKMDWEFFVLYIYQKKKHQGFRNCKEQFQSPESPQWHKGKPIPIPKTLLQLGMQALMGGPRWFYSPRNDHSVRCRNDHHSGYDAMAISP